MSTLAIVPARSGSKGIPGKNFKVLAGISPVERAIGVCVGLGINGVVSTDTFWLSSVTGVVGKGIVTIRALQRPPELAQDDTPMIAVVQHALAKIPGPPEQIICLLQPTQPLRQPKHILAAIELMDAGARCVVSVTEAESPDRLYRAPENGLMYPWDDTAVTERRQDARSAFKRDGTVYMWRRDDEYWHWPFVPLIIPAEETCALDTTADWAEAERRLKEKA